MIKVLTADDNFTTGMQIEEMLTALGYDIVGQAGSGREAVEMARELSPHIILMDIVMPGELNGIEAARKIRVESDVPIVFISGHGESEYIQEAKEIEPYGYVMKPFDENEIRAFIEIALHKHKMERRLKEAHEQLERANRRLMREIKERREKQEFSNFLLNSSPNPIMLIGPDSAVRYVNPAFEALMGFSFSEMVGEKTPYSCWMSDTPHKERNTFLEAIFKGPRKQEAKFQNKQGGDVWVEINSVPVIKDGEPLYVISNWVDVTDRKKTQEALRESEERFRYLADASMEAIFFSKDGIGLEANQAAAEMFGYDDRSKFIGMFGTEIIAPESHEIVKAHLLENVFEPYEAIGERKDGTKFPISIRAKAMPYKDKGMVRVTSVSDITERKHAEEALRESEKKYRFLVENSNDLIWTFDLASMSFSFCSNSMESVLGYTPDEAIGMKLRDILSPETRKAVLAGFGRIVSGEPASDRILLEAKHIAKSGRRVWMEINAVVQRDESGQAVAFNGVSRDITERKRTEEALRESEEKLRVIFDTVHSGIILVDAAGVITFANRRMAEMFGRDMEELIGSSYVEHVHETQSDEGKQKMFQLIRGDIDHVFLERRYRKKDGTVFWGHLSGSRLCGPDGAFSSLVGVIADISEKKRLEDQLQHAKKMEAIATLTGGIAHDYNNLLSIIMGNLSMAMEEVESSSRPGNFLLKANVAVHKVRNLTRELMSLSRGGTPVMEIGSLNELLKSVSDIMPVGGRYSLKKSIPKNLRLFPHDPLQMAAVFRNVTTNAMEAMPGGGTIEIKTENLHIAQKDSGPGPSLTPGDYIHISIRDQGAGIPKENLKEIFNPYFSTKEKGTQKGMGLGLTTAYAIIKNHGGHMAVDSTPGMGTTVHIYLAAESQPLKTDKKISSKDDAASPVKWVLVMDDEEMLRNMAEQVLKRLGYEAETVKDGIDAIHAYKKRLQTNEPFDLVILDLTITGGMGGEQTIAELLTIDPNIKAIVSSGYSDNPVMSDCKKYGFIGRIPKPYSMKILKEALESIFK